MKNYICKIFCLLILFLFIGILSKSNLCFRQKINYYLYEDSLDFSVFRDVYNNYFGDVFPFEFNNTISVFSEDIKYLSINKYFDGYSLEVDYEYLVPAIDGGIVTYVGYKENYGNVVIVMGDDGVSIWYGNLFESNFKLYDTVLAGDFIGQVDEDSLYLVFSDESGFLGYEGYL